MRTEIIKVTAQDSDVINKAAALIKSGELVAFPTETVYGLGADGFNASAYQKIYEVKGRPDNKPLSLLVSDRAMIEELAEISPIAEKLIETFMPGPLTLILNQHINSAFRIPNSELTIGVRMPDNEITLALIKAANCPIAAPSANISGQAPPTNAQEVFKYFDGNIPLILDGGECTVGISSTVVDLTHDKPVILREGSITLDMII